MLPPRLIRPFQKLPEACICELAACVLLFAVPLVALPMMPIRSDAFWP
jgi:hypothetical protein